MRHQGVVAKESTEEAFSGASCQDYRNFPNHVVVFSHGLERNVAIAKTLLGDEEER